MNEQELLQKRLLDLSRQAEMKGIVTFSDFLNLSEQNIYHSMSKNLYTATRVFGGYESAERQMVAFIPDALSYEWDFPIRCLSLEPQYPKFAEKLSHRDVLGAMMNLGIERRKLGDIVAKEKHFYVFCEENIGKVIEEQLQKVKHTLISVHSVSNWENFDITPEFEVIHELIASNRIDCIIARAYHFSRSEASEWLLSEKVFMNGKCITNCNQSVSSGDIISVRGRGRFIFETGDSVSKKGKLRITIKKYI